MFTQHFKKIYNFFNQIWSNLSYKKNFTTSWIFCIERKSRTKKTLVPLLYKVQEAACEMVFSSTEYKSGFLLALRRPQPAALQGDFIAPLCAYFAGEGSWFRRWKLPGNLHRKRLLGLFLALKKKRGMVKVVVN